MLQNRFSAAGVLALCAACSPAPPVEKAKEAPKAEYFKVDPATAGSISGKVAFSGRKPKPKTILMDQDADCQKAHAKPAVYEDVVVNANGTLANVFVYVKTGLEGKQFEPATAPVVLDQKGCLFVPRVFGIRTGQPLTVTNSDPVTHNVHPIPRENREWNQGQPPGSGAIERQFAKPEVMITVKCNVHSWMRSNIGVVDHPYFAVSGSDGAFKIANLPPGSYTVEAWHEKLGVQTQSVTVAPSAAATADYTFKGE